MADTRSFEERQRDLIGVEQAARLVGVEEIERWHRTEMELRAKLAAAERECATRKEALEAFANPQHWAIRRDAGEPSFVWIGTYHDTPISVAEAALRLGGPDPGERAR